MKRLAIVSALFFLILISCKKDNVIDTKFSAVSAFSFANTNSDTLVVGTYDQVSPIDSSTNATSYQWDFGNDTIKSGKDVVVFYPKAGIYQLKLTVVGSYGTSSVASKPVKVLNRVMKKIIIKDITDFNSTNLALNSNGFDSIWVTVKLGENNVSYMPPSTIEQSQSQSLDAPIILQTKKIKVGEITFPLSVDITSKIIVDFAKLASFNISYDGIKNIGYGLELNASSGGKNYILSSSYFVYYQSQSGSITWIADFSKNTFTMKYGSVEVLCDYE